MQGQTWRSSGEGQGRAVLGEMKEVDHGSVGRGKGGVWKQHEPGEWKNQKQGLTLQAENVDVLHGSGKDPEGCLLSGARVGEPGSLPPAEE